MEKRTDQLLVPMVQSIIPGEGYCSCCGRPETIELKTADERIKTAACNLRREILSACAHSAPRKGEEENICHHISIFAGETDSSDQSYTLSIFSNAIEIRSAGAAGAFYGIQTLRQLIKIAL